MITASVSLSCHVDSCAKTAERINILLGVKTPGDPRDIDEGLHSPMANEKGSMWHMPYYVGQLFCMLPTLFNAELQ